MSLRDDVVEAIYDALCDNPEDPFTTTQERAEGVATAVWAMLEDKVGTAQEQLLTQLTQARDELAALRRRETVFTETMQAQHRRISDLEASMETADD